MHAALNPFHFDREHQMHRYTLLAPVGWRLEHRFREVVVDPSAHLNLIADLQRFRGKAYLSDGALRPDQLTADGRHLQAADEDSWHLVVQNDQGDLIACARYYLLREPLFESTSISKSALARRPEWRAKVKRVFDDSITGAKRRGAQFAELGGWCVANEARNTCHALRSVLCMYALGEILGGTVGLSTATTRHSSSSILQRLGAKKADLDGEALPSYFDPIFDCEMELLQFDSRYPAQRYERQVAQFQEMIKAGMRVIRREHAPPTCISSLLGLATALGPSTMVETNVPLAELKF